MSEHIDQRSEDWFAARLGKATASRIVDVMATLKSGKPAASRENYAAQLVAERLTGAKSEGFTNAAMQWGVDMEPEARAAYAEHIGDQPVEIGFIDHPTIAMSGASPDGLVGFDGMLEIKCPNTATHIATLRGAPIERKYVLQMQWQMACAEREWCDFASYDPRMPEEMRLHVRRVERDDELIAEIEQAVSAFLAEIDETVAELSAAYRKAA
ncbi:exonuclease [Altererythrobacter marinus]|uniref:Exonuclease n=1 Tax=Pelagerythrobacter marinus TaxID=538382 RepID=A0ABW9UUY8_9SPHN|nr:lambda exonuclease family protein [Pelagerythrobacter marinus]MXO67754.1 exonuclease [Pelagerythrobacter marinus]